MTDWKATNIPDLTGKIVLVTGASNGLGKASAQLMAAKGVRVVMAVRTVSKGEMAAEDIRKAVPNAHLTVMALNLASVRAFATDFTATHDRLDILVNNAGVIVLGDGSVLGGTMDDWGWVMGVNFFGVLYGIREFIPRMIEQDSECHVVNVSSSLGLIPAGGSYGVSKHAVVALSEALYFELGESKVNVSVYCPDRVHTELDTIERSRPERFKNEPPSKQLSEEAKAGLSEFVKGGLSIDESANFVFDGLRENKLYIGPKAFQYVKKDILELIRNRAENIINERNPE